MNDLTISDPDARFLPPSAAPVHLPDGEDAGFRQDPSAIKAVAMRKVARRLIPLLCVVYVIAFSYRSNISFTSLTMSNDLGLKPPMFGLVAEPFLMISVVAPFASTLSVLLLLRSSRYSSTSRSVS